MARAVKVMPIMAQPPRVFPTAPPMPEWLTQTEPEQKAEEVKVEEVVSVEPIPASPSVPKLKPLGKVAEPKAKSLEAAPVNVIGEV